MEPTPSIHERHQAELDLQESAESPPRAAGITVDDGNNKALEDPNGHSPQTTMVNASGAALAFNGHSLDYATSQGNPCFGAFPHIGYHPAANYSHLTPNIASPWGVVSSEGVVNAMSQPSLQPYNLMGTFEPYADATHHQHHDDPNQYQFVTPANDLRSNRAPFHVDGFDGTSSGFQLPLNMSGATVSQHVGNLNSNGIDENWNPPTNPQPDFSFSGAGNELFNPQTNDFGALPMSHQPYAHPVLAHTSGAFHQYPAPPLLQGYAPTENRQLGYNDPMSMQTGSTGLIGPLSTASQDMALHNSYGSMIAEGDGHSENVGQIQSFQQSGSINSLAPSDSLNPALTAHDGVYDLSGHIFPDMQQPTDFAGQTGEAGLNGQTHSVYPARTIEEPNNLSSSFATGYEMVPWATGPPSTDMTLRQRELKTQPSAPNLQFERQSSAELPKNDALVIYGPERPPRNPSRRVAKRSRKMPKSASESNPLATQKKLEERRDRQLSRLASRTQIPKDRIAAFGECTSYTVKKRGKGTQKAARKRGTCTRCHLYHLRCDDGEGECCNNCQRFWATLAAGCTHWRWTRDYRKSLIKEFWTYCRPKLYLLPALSIDEIKLRFSDPKFSTLMGIVDFVSEQKRLRYLLLCEPDQSETPDLYLGYTCQIVHHLPICQVINPKSTPLLSDYIYIFFLVSALNLGQIEALQNLPDLGYVLRLAYTFVEFGETGILHLENFWPWLLQALATRLKISLARLMKDGDHKPNALATILCTLNESAAGRALLPRRFHDITWSGCRVKLPKSSTSVAHIICADPPNHEKECWCGLLLSSIPLDVMRFFGIGDEKDKYEFQWNTFFAKHCTWIRGLGNPRELFIKGRWMRSTRRIFTIQLQMVLKSVSMAIKIWQAQSVLELTHEELMVDCEHWQHRTFGVTLGITAGIFCYTVFESPQEDTIRANMSQRGISEIVNPILFKILAARKFDALRKKNRARDIDDITDWVEAQITAKESSGSAIT